MIAIALMVFMIQNLTTKEESLVQINYDEFVQKMTNKDNFVLCISQTTCNHCRKYKPTLRKIAKENNIKIYYIEFDLLDQQEKELFQSYLNFSATPTTVFIKNGEEQSMATRINGGKSEEYTINKLKSNGFIK